MPVSRRHLMRHFAGGALSLSVGGGVRPVAASGGGALVLARNGLGVRYVDPRSGDVGAWDGPRTVAADATTAAASTTMPADVAVTVSEGAVGYWMVPPGGGAIVVRIDTGASSSWWWRRAGGRPVALDLPGDLEPAFPSGTSARWFHGATANSAHLGSGTMRLLAVDLETGGIVLDQVLDRRLELAATRVSPEGAIVAHVQSATTGVTLWAADLRGGGVRAVVARVDEAPGMAAASAIDLDAATDGDAALVAAGIARDWPGAPEATVYTWWSAPPDIVRTASLPGELIGIVSPEADAG